MRPDASKRLAAAAPKKGPNAVVLGAVIAAIVVVGVVVAIVVIGGISKKNSTSASTSASGSGGSGSSAQPAAAIGGMGSGIQVNAGPVTATATDTATTTTTSSAPKPKSNAPMAKSNAPTLDLYEDFQCPGCASLERNVGAKVAELAKAGEIKLVVHMLSFLDGNLPQSNQSSARSANAAACASDAGKFLDYHAAVFAAQPDQEGEGYTDDRLTEFAKTSGITGAALTTWQKCTSSGQYAKYVTSVQDGMASAGVESTPTVKLNGQDITKTLATPDALVAAVKDATK